ncbi:MAG: FemAB family PEP-CTERM system-associated protein [Gammaproteobacteria bacterium]|nr:FemAB-like protein [Gammaproteobacteria bacterium]
MSVSTSTSQSDPNFEQPGKALALDIVDADDRAEWNAFLASREDGSFYHLYEWREINARALGHESVYLAARAHGQIVGVLPLTFVRSRLFGRILCSLPFVNFGGPCASDDEVVRALLHAAKCKADELGADYMELRCVRPLETDWPVSLRKVSMTIELNADPDVLWNSFTSKHRTNVRRSYKNGLQVRSGHAELLPTFYALMEQSWRSLGTPLYARSYFERILADLSDYTRIFVCYRGDEPIATAFNGYFNGTVEGLWAGGIPQARALQANYALYWEMIRDACLRGFRRYHLGRSTADSGAEDFKKKWNATSSQLYWYFYRPRGGEMPALNVDNPKYRLAINAWRRLPLFVTRTIGPSLARLIP